ncbi:hypothetical protein L218DRAFT_1008747 [Marasmius fiardii PR-910]|nr:hypothetical protein L218DRAFT_1008747 [Marasmius fiardii PR-910]
MINNSAHTTISRGNFTIVNGNQHITYPAHSEPDVQLQPRFLPEDEWKIELYREYDQVLKGRIRLLRTTGEGQEEVFEYGTWEREAKRVFSVARLSTGNEPLFTSVAYTGPGTKKAFKKDFVTFSQIKHANVAQLYAFNDSASPMIFFHDELIPLQAVMQNHPDCHTALVQYIAIQDALICTEIIPSSLTFWNNVWIRPCDGTLVYGPDGPPVSFWCPRLGSVALTAARRRTIHPLSPKLFNSRNLVNFLAICLPSFIPPRPRILLGKRPLSSDARLTVLSTFSRSLHIIANYPDLRGDVLWGLQNWLNDPSLDVMNDGRTRLQITPFTSPTHCFQFCLGYDYQHRRSSIWLAQACRVFKTLSIPRDEWKVYGYVYKVDLELFPVTEETGYPRFDDKGHYRGFVFPCYLFVRPFLRFADGFPDMSCWNSGTDLYYWSTDPNGHSAMTDEERVALGLPRYVPKVETYMRTWSLKDYDFIRELQGAKGFDPTTTDFARSLGYPILEILRKESRFEVVPDNLGSCFSSFSGRNEADLMKVDSSFIGVDIGDSTLSSSTVVEDMDVDMGDCRCRDEHFAIDVGMEMDD